jgi:hypothetical protein
MKIYNTGKVKYYIIVYYLKFLGEIRIFGIFDVFVFDGLSLLCRSSTTFLAQLAVK